jgi:hypothetical protein
MRGEAMPRPNNETRWAQWLAILRSLQPAPTRALLVVGGVTIDEVPLDALDPQRPLPATVVVVVGIEFRGERTLVKFVPTRAVGGSELRRAAVRFALAVGDEAPAPAAELRGSRGRGTRSSPRRPSRATSEAPRGGWMRAIEALGLSVWLLSPLGGRELQDEAEVLLSPSGSVAVAGADDDEILRLKAQGFRPRARLRKAG